VQGSSEYSVELGEELGEELDMLEDIPPSVKQCCGSGPGSGAFLTPGSGIRNRFFPDPGSRIPDPKPIFLRAW
jgi:hypothetical protein